MEHWRLISDPAQDGATNMAIDEAILEAVGRGEAPPTLRLYRWEPACLSLGYAQPVSDADSARLAERGWHLVRRMTGGRAILHTDELTYSVALPITHPLLTGSIPESYRQISGALLEAVMRLGAAVNADKRATKPQQVGAVCFEVPSDYEITAQGKKLIGSAQVRRSTAALQHGSLPLAGEIERICDGLAFADEAQRQVARDRVAARATTLAAVIEHPVTWEAAAEAVTAAFAECFDLQFEIGALSDFERQRADTLRAHQYAAPAWTAKR